MPETTAQSKFSGDAVLLTKSPVNSCYPCGYDLHLRKGKLMADIAERSPEEKNAVNGLEESGRNEKRFRAMVQSGNDLILLANASFNVNYISPNYYQITGYSFAEVQGLLGKSLIHPDDYESVVREAYNVFSQKVVQLPHFRFKVKDGSYKWLETTLSNFLQEEDINAIIFNARDITYKKKAHEEVEMLSTLAQESLNSMVVTDPDGLITWINKAFTKRTGYTLEEALGNKASNLLHREETCQKTRSYMRSCMKKQVPFNCEIINYSKSGRKHWVELKGQPIFDENGSVKNWFSIQTDITERKEAIEAMRLSEERYKFLFYKSPTPKWFYNVETDRIIEVNDAACNLYGYSKEEFLSMTVQDIIVDEEIHLYNQIVRDILIHKKPIPRVSARFKKKNGEELKVEVNAHAMELRSGYHFIFSAYDLTEKLALQDKIIEEKVIAQQKIAKAIIQTQEKERSYLSKELHDNVNQLLTVAKLCIENTQYYPEQKDVFTERSLTMIQNAIQEIRSLSKALVSPAIKDVGLKLSVLEMLDQYKSLNRFSITDELEFNEESIDMELKVTIYRIIQELLNNMVKYAQATQVFVKIRQSEGHLTVVIQDNGAGFNTTAKKDGLGLANIKHRVELFKGKLAIESSSGKGCTSVAVFPL